jgi:7-cyano-7-deazaguanine synthase in queuosine biosynthesis
MATNSLIFRIDPNDAELPTDLDPASHQTTITLMDKMGILGHGIGDTLNSLQARGLQPTEVAVDLIILASAVYAADKHINRRRNSQDSWTREINLHIPVSDPSLWAGVAERLEKALHFLTGDLWRPRFHSRPASHPRLASQVKSPPLLMPDSVSLFSGGLDSFVGAIDILAEDRRPLLVSHGWVSSDNNHQKACLQLLKTAFRNDDIPHLQSRIGFNNDLFGVENRRESTERSRSFLFFSLAALSSSALGTNTKILVPENGLISLNIPIDLLRLGSLSTRTTHPYFMSRFNEILDGIGINARLENPYRHKTKGEMVGECKNQAVLRAGLAQTISCSSPNKARWVPQADRPVNYTGSCHCGWCVPCVIRRAAINAAGITDPTPYLLPNIGTQQLNSTKARGTDIRSFQVAIDRLKNSETRARAIIRETGPLSDFPNEIEDFVQMYLRGMREVERLIKTTIVAPNV